MEDEFDLPGLMRHTAHTGQRLWALMSAAEQGLIHEANAIMDEILAEDRENVHAFMLTTVMSLSNTIDAFCHVAQIDREAFVRQLATSTARMEVLADELESGED